MQNFSLLIKNENLVSISVEAHFILCHLVGNYNIHYCFFHPFGCMVDEFLVSNVIFSLTRALEILNLKIVYNYAKKILSFTDR
jgi:hypothetical protein